MKEAAKLTRELLQLTQVKELYHLTQGALVLTGLLKLISHKSNLPAVTLSTIKKIKRKTSLIVKTEKV